MLEPAQGFLILQTALFVSGAIGVGVIVLSIALRLSAVIFLGMGAPYECRRPRIRAYRPGPKNKRAAIDRSHHTLSKGTRAADNARAVHALQGLTGQIRTSSEINGLERTNH